MRLTEMVTPLKPLEAMAMRKVFVASDVGGHGARDQTASPACCFAPAIGKPGARKQSFVWSATQCCANDSTRRAQRFVREERTWTRAVRGYEGVYARVLGRASDHPMDSSLSHCRERLLCLRRFALLSPGR